MRNPTRLREQRSSSSKDKSSSRNLQRHSNTSQNRSARKTAPVLKIKPPAPATCKIPGREPTLLISLSTPLSLDAPRKQRHPGRTCQKTASSPSGPAKKCVIPAGLAKKLRHPRPDLQKNCVIPAGLAKKLRHPDLTCPKAASSRPKRSEVEGPPHLPLSLHLFVLRRL